MRTVRSHYARPSATGFQSLNRQIPAWGTGDAAMRAAAVGGIILDAISSRRLLRVTDSTDHATACAHEYSGGPDITSLPWQVGGAGDYYLTLGYTLTSGSGFFKDLNLRTLVLSNKRAAPTGFTTIKSAFSRNPATPRILYYLSGASLNTITRYDTATDSAAPSGVFPKNLSTIATGGSHDWLHQDNSDRWFVFQSIGSGYAIAYDSQTDTATKKTLADMQAVVPAITGLNEPHLSKNGAGTTLNCDTNKILWWEFSGHTMVDRSALAIPVHQDTFLDLHAMFINSGGSQGVYRVDYPGNSKTNVASYTAMTDGATHQSTHHIPAGATTLADFWIEVSCEEDGQITNFDSLTWMLHSGTAGVDAVWKTTPGYRYNQTNARMASGGFATQYADGQVRVQYRTSPTVVGSIAAVQAAAGTYFHDGGTNTSYCRAFGEKDLGGVDSGYIGLWCPNGLNEGIGFVKGDGSLTRYLCAHFSNEVHPVLGSGNYWGIPRAHYAQSGYGVLFTTSMGVRGGRTDVWWAEIPNGVL